MTHTFTGRGRHWADVLDIVHDNPSTITRRISSATGRFLREQHDVRCVRIICIPFMYNQCKGCSQKTNIYYSSLDGCYPIPWNTSVSAPRVVDWRGTVFKKCCTQCTQTENLMLLVSPQRLVWKCTWLRNRTVCDTGSTWRSALRRLSWRNSPSCFECYALACPRRHVV
jgi:hypothetical protein